MTLPPLQAQRYGSLSKMLSGADLFRRCEAPPRLSTDFFFPDSAGDFCGMLSLEDIQRDFFDTNILSTWQAQGHARIWVTVPGQQEPGRHELQVWSQISDKSELLLQLIVWLEYVCIERFEMAFPAFCVEHLRLQNPLSLPHPNHKLPGQDFAPSGTLRKVFALLQHWASRCGAQLITEIPQYFHTAYIFHPYFHYVDLPMAAIFHQIQTDLLPPNPTPNDIARLSMAFESGLVMHNDTPYLWPTELQAHGLSCDLAKNLAVHPSHDLDGHFSISNPPCLIECPTPETAPPAPDPAAPDDKSARMS
ncbi:MAG: hypothetical protein FWC40_02160 [Proteobacteria bacterium]|nr:hypothetical protein [Pseudomonadota bacterium]